MLPIILAIICISGLFLPQITMYVAFINAGARIIYTFMYVKLLYLIMIIISKLSTFTIISETEQEHILGHNNANI